MIIYLAKLMEFCCFLYVSVTCFVYDDGDTSVVSLTYKPKGARFKKVVVNR